MFKLQSFSLFEKNYSDLEKEYMTFFRSVLKKYRIEKLSDLSEENKGKFWFDIKTGWVKNKGRTKRGKIIQKMHG